MAHNVCVMFDSTLSEFKVDDEQFKKKQDHINSCGL